MEFFRGYHIISKILEGQTYFTWKFLGVDDFEAISSGVRMKHPSSTRRGADILWNSPIATNTSVFCESTVHTTWFATFVRRPETTSKQTFSL